MNDRSGHEAPVVVMVTPKHDAVRWAAAYADRRGSPLRILHVSPRVSTLVDELRASYPGLPIDHRLVVEAIGDALIAESQHAHSIVLADSGEEVLDGESVEEYGNDSMCGAPRDQSEPCYPSHDRTVPMPWEVEQD